MLNFNLRVASIALVLINLILFQHTIAKLKFCSRGQHEILSPFDAKQTSEKGDECSGGVLFSRQLRLRAITSDHEKFCIKRSVCDEGWVCGSKKQSVLAQVITFAGEGLNNTKRILKDDSEIDEYIPECYPREIWRIQQKPTSSRSKRDITGLVPSDPTSLEDIQKEVDDQTKRMFYYLTAINQDQVNSHLRVVKLFKMATELVSMICDPLYIRPKFLQEVAKSFLFLLKEQGFDKMIDLDLESYNQLKQSLEYCATNVTMVKFMGGSGSCPAGIKVESVYTIEGDKIKSFKYERNEKTFKWGEYDIVLDAAWSIMNIVHGGCFESFAQNVNLHHKFQVAIEQLFHAALHLRWENPTQLADDQFYDSIFMARVNDTMEVMDACSRYLYLLTPFKIQLNRPIHETAFRRKKRSTRSYEEDANPDGQTANRDMQERTVREYSNKLEEKRLELLTRLRNTVEVGNCLPSQTDMERELKIMKTAACPQSVNI